MSNEEFAEWLKTCFSDEKALALLSGKEELPDSLSKEQMEFMARVLSEGRKRFKPKPVDIRP